MLSPDQIRNKLKGYPDHLVASCLEFENTRDPEVLKRFVSGVLEFFAADAAGTSPPDDEPVATGNEKLEVDSVTLAEVVFLLEGLLEIEIEDETLRGLQDRKDLDRFLDQTARAIPHR